jgi:hypothetical protein
MGLQAARAERLVEGIAMHWSPFRSKVERRASSEAPVSIIAVSWNREGVEFRAVPSRDGWLESSADFGVDSELKMLLGQLEEEGYAEARREIVWLSWSDFYRAAASTEHQASVYALKLPPVEPWRPVLSSKETLVDPDFAVSIAGWLDPEGRRPNGNVAINGAVIHAGDRESVLPESSWRLVESVVRFWARPTIGRDADSNRRAWSIIRSHAVNAGADLTDFLRKTVVLTPERLRIGMRKGDVGGASMVEIQPGFDGAPDRWLEMFDRLGDVPDRYDIPDGNGIVHVMLAPQVRAVLREIRRMPGRRIAGDRAESFLRNPFATLGPDAAEVIDPEQFEKARDDAGVSFARFTARVQRDENGFPYQCALVVEETIGGELRADELRFEGVVELEMFLSKLEARIAASAQCCHWQGYDLEILGDTPDQYQLLRDAQREISSPRVLKASEIFDITRYSDRVEGFGIEKPYYSPFIARKSGDAGWFPENVDFGLCYTPEGGGDTVAVVLSDESVDAFRTEARKAEDEAREVFDFPGCPRPVPVRWANEVLDTIGNVRAEVAERAFDPASPSTRAKASERKGLVIKPNVSTLDYAEQRGSLAPTGGPARLPESLRSEIALKEHQLQGVAWLQHLWRLSPTACRGALLADDMGLGKTIQLLTFIAAALEDHSAVDPFLIVAPVSLLENWKEEIA